MSLDDDEEEEDYENFESMSFRPSSPKEFSSHF
jgi:hypothetical protein